MAELFASLLHPSEVTALIRMKLGGHVSKTRKEPLDKLATCMSSMQWCYAVLDKVSRSFAVVIRQLPAGLRDVICIFYLALRGLDSIEDDMDVPRDVKLPLLRNFHTKLYEDGWRLPGVGDSADYKMLMANFFNVIAEFKRLDAKYQVVIADISQKMGNGMADFVGKTPRTREDYNLYCHYVAGLVGIGLTRLFAEFGEDASLLTDEGLRQANSMGLFLQKANIIRDYCEDLEQGRTWWPQEIWGLYATQLSHFREQPTHEASLACLNHMVDDALQHMDDCLQYLKRLKNPLIFRFCAIPQVMALATLSAVYNNPRVFTENVKIRKGLAAQIMLDTKNMAGVDRWFNTFAGQLMDKVEYVAAAGGEYSQIAVRSRDLLSFVMQKAKVGVSRSTLKLCSVLAWIILIVGVAYMLLHEPRKDDTASFLPVVQVTSLTGHVLLVLGIIAIGYLFGFFGVVYV